MKKKRTNPLISFFTALALAVTQVMPAGAALTAEAVPSVESGSPLQLPPDLGTIQALHLGTGPTLIHLQDAHGNYEAQKKIQAILKHLRDRYGFKLLLLEGSAFKLKPELIRLFPNYPDITSEVLDRLTKEGIAQGEELFLAETTDVEAYGIENLEAYLANGEAFRAVLTEQERTEGFLRDMDMQIERLTGPFLNKDLRAFLGRLEDFEAKRLPLMDWLSYLKGEAKKRLEIDLSDPAYQLDWPNLERIYKLAEFESKLDAKALVREKDEFLGALRSIPKDLFASIEKFLSSPVSRHQLPSPETRQLFEKMVTALPQDFNYDAYPNVKRFVGHLILQSEVKGEPLMEEMNRLTDQISEASAKTGEEKKILSLLKDHRLLKRLFALELTPDDYEKTAQAGESLRPSKVIGRFVELNQSGRVRNVEFTGLGEIDLLFVKAMEFYRGVKDRDQWMIQNVEARLRETGADKAVVITGGFHAEPFQNFFAGKGYNYALIAPKITTTEGRESYIRSILEYQGKPTEVTRSTHNEVQKLGFDSPELKAQGVDRALIDLAILGPTFVVLAERGSPPQEVGEISVGSARFEGVEVRAEVRDRPPTFRITLPDRTEYVLPAVPFKARKVRQTIVPDASRAVAVQAKVAVPEVQAGFRAEGRLTQAVPEVVQEVPRGEVRGVAADLKMPFAPPEGVVPRAEVRLGPGPQGIPAPVGEAVGPTIEPGLAAPGQVPFAPSPEGIAPVGVEAAEGAGGIPSVIPTVPGPTIGGARPAEGRGQARTQPNLPVSTIVRPPTIAPAVPAPEPIARQPEVGRGEAIESRIPGAGQPGPLVNLVGPGQEGAEAVAGAPGVTPQPIVGERGAGEARIPFAGEEGIPGPLGTIEPRGARGIPGGIPKLIGPVVGETRGVEEVTPVGPQPNIPVAPPALPGAEARLGEILQPVTPIPAIEELGISEAILEELRGIGITTTEALVARVREGVEGPAGLAELEAPAREAVLAALARTIPQVVFIASIGLPETVTVLIPPQIQTLGQLITRVNEPASLAQIPVEIQPAVIARLLALVPGEITNFQALGISLETAQALQAEGISSVSELIKLSEIEPQEIKTLRERIAEIRGALGRFGVTLGAEVPAGPEIPEAPRGAEGVGVRPGEIAGTVGTEGIPVVAPSAASPAEGVIGPATEPLRAEAQGAEVREGSAVAEMEALGVEPGEARETEPAEVIKLVVPPVGPAQVVGEPRGEASRAVAPTTRPEEISRVEPERIEPGVRVRPAETQPAVPGAGAGIPPEETSAPGFPDFIGRDIVGPQPVVPPTIAQKEIQQIFTRFVPFASQVVLVEFAGFLVAPSLRSEAGPPITAIILEAILGRPVYGVGVAREVPVVTTIQEITGIPTAYVVSPTGAYLQVIQAELIQLAREGFDGVVLDEASLGEFRAEARELLNLFRVFSTPEGEPIVNRPLIAVVVTDEKRTRSELRDILTNINNGLVGDERILARNLSLRLDQFIKIIEIKPGQTGVGAVNEYVQTHSGAGILMYEILEGLEADANFVAGRQIWRKNRGVMSFVAVEVGRAGHRIRNLKTKDPDEAPRLIQAQLIRELGIVVSIQQRAGRSYLVIQTLAQFVETLRAQKHFEIAA